MTLFDTTTIHNQFPPRIMYLRLLLLLLLLLLVFLSFKVRAVEINTDLRCPKQCVCTEEYLADLPLMRWSTIPMNKYVKQNESLVHNKVPEDEESAEIQSDNPLVQAAFCVFQENSNKIERNQFTPTIEALTILHGADTTNRTIEYELSSFGEALSLDIQGYAAAAAATTNDNSSYVTLQYNALLQLHQLRYLNVQHVRLLPNPNTKNKDVPASAHTLLSHAFPNRFPNAIPISSSNLTFLAAPEEPEVVPYTEYRKQHVISTFRHLANLLFLRVYRCRLAAITWDMFDGLDKLETLSLEGNLLAKLPEFAFYGMPSLKSLILSDNRLAHIRTESFAGLFQLRNLDLRGNRLRHLSDATFAPLPRLLNADLRENPLALIRSNTFEVINATQVMLIGDGGGGVANGSLVLERNAFNGLVELRKLIVRGLNISTLEKNVLLGMRGLRHLELAGRIEYVDFDSFTGSIQLETLILRGCSLRFVSMDAFYNLYQLRVLDLSANELESLPNGVFDQLESLRELLLSGNKFTKLPPGIFSKLGRVKMVHLRENPWHCSCDMQGWPFLALGKVKESRLIEKPCYASYDKSVCESRVEDVYVSDPDTVPTCFTPALYNGWNLIHVVSRKLNCARRPKPRRNRKSTTAASQSATTSPKPPSTITNEPIRSLTDLRISANPAEEANNLINDL